MQGKGSFFPVRGDWLLGWVKDDPVFEAMPANDRPTEEDIAKGASQAANASIAKEIYDLFWVERKTNRGITPSWGITDKGNAVRLLST